MSIVLGILTFVLILVSIFLVLIVLMQKSKDGGMGAALGGGAAEAAFGADTNAFTVARRGNSKFVAVIHPEDGHVMTAIGTLPDEHCVKALQTYIVAIHPKLGTVLVHIAALRQVT